MSVEFQEESIMDVWDEMEPIAIKHHDEVSSHKDIPLNLDKLIYSSLDKSGVLKFFTIRDGQRLIGYASLVASKHPHYDIKCSYQDGLFLDAAYRGKLVGFKFIQWCDDNLKKDGVTLSTQNVNKNHNFGRMLTKIGYDLTDLMFTRRL